MKLEEFENSEFAKTAKVLTEIEAILERTEHDPIVRAQDAHSVTFEINDPEDWEVNDVDTLKDIMDSVIAEYGDRPKFSYTIIPANNDERASCVRVTLDTSSESE